MKNILLLIFFKLALLASFNSFASSNVLIKGSEINSQDALGNTSLFYAIKEGNIVSVERLLRHPNINTNLKNRLGETALDFARKIQANQSIISLLVTADIINVNSLLLGVCKKLKEREEVTPDSPTLKARVKNILLRKNSKVRPG
jgi:ankyrin repeat protein